MVPTGNSHKLRIIGGQWRGRKISFAQVDTVRPTPDRVRETLFNWLQPTIAGARCLDLFAGSGVLGIEAVSRGAAQAILLDSDRHAVNTIQAQLGLLGAENMQVYQMDALSFLESPPPGVGKPFDIVFLDPPFGQNGLSECLDKLVRYHWLAGDASIYIESGSLLQAQDLPDKWKIHRVKKAGKVNYHLIQLIQK